MRARVRESQKRPSSSFSNAAVAACWSTNARTHLTKQPVSTAFSNCSPFCSWTNPRCTSPFVSTNDTNHLNQRGCLAAEDRCPNSRSASLVSSANLHRDRSFFVAVLVVVTASIDSTSCRKAEESKVNQAERSGEKEIYQSLYYFFYFFFCVVAPLFLLGFGALKGRVVMTPSDCPYSSEPDLERCSKLSACAFCNMIYCCIYYCYCCCIICAFCDRVSLPVLLLPRDSFRLKFARFLFSFTSSIPRGFFS